MRQSTLLFGQDPGGNDGAEGSKPRMNGEGSTEDQGGRKRVRRAAASKSEERTKRQAQMTFALNGHLQSPGMADNSDDKGKNEVITVADDGSSDEEEVQPVRVKRKEKTYNGETKPREPISLTVRGTQRNPTEAVHSFFAKRPALGDSREAPPAPLKERQATFKQRWPLHKEAAWPDSSNAHVQPKDDEATLHSDSVALGDLRKSGMVSKVAAMDTSGPSPWQYMLNKPTGLSSRPSNGTEYRLQAISTAQSSIDLASCMQNGIVPHALQRLSDKNSIGESKENNLLWTDRWRPTKACEVLGNEGRASILRDWLDHLRVTADTASQPVQRKVAKRRKKEKPSSMGEFIVDDEEEDEAWYEHYRRPDDKNNSDIEEIDSTGPTHGTGGSQNTLRNAMLLTGPTGSGKTAAVYACAAELEFEVFEIYPGQGKRSGKEIGQAVGDLGRNHMVSSGGTGGGSTWKSFKEKDVRQKTGSILSEADQQRSANGKAPRQSLILLEEVDLLFEEDKGFWTAVIELISTSRRPVVLTCNTVHSIPFEMICLQDTLYFEPPTEAVATCYLQLMALCQGRDLSREAAMKIYKETAGSAQENRSMSSMVRPNSGMIDPNTELASMDKSVNGKTSFDLRQAIMQLQFHCQKGLDKDGIITAGTAPSMIASEVSISPLLLPFRDAIRKSEIRSFSDALLSRPSDRQREIHEPDEYEDASRANDVHYSSLIALPKVRVKLESTTLAETGREEEYHKALLGQEEEELIEVENAGDLKRARCSAIMLEVLASLSVPASHLVPSEPVVIDYVPTVDLMIKVDDAEHATYHARLKQAAQDIQMQRTASEEGKAEALQAAQRSLFEIGIRPSRQSTRMLLERGNDGLLALGRRDTAPCRWIETDSKLMQEMREIRLHF